MHETLFLLPRIFIMWSPLLVLGFYLYFAVCLRRLAKHHASVANTLDVLTHTFCDLLDEVKAKRSADAGRAERPVAQ